MTIFNSLDTDISLPDPNELALEGRIQAPHLGYECGFDPHESLKRRIRAFNSLRERLHLAPITLHTHSWQVGNRPHVDYAESVVAELEARMQLVSRLVAFNFFRRSKGLRRVKIQEHHWTISGVPCAYIRQKVREFELHMQAIERLQPQIDSLSARLQAIGRSGVTYLEAGFRLHCGGHTYRYTTENLLLAEAEVAQMERQLHQHAADVAAGRQAYAGLATRADKLSAPWKLRITLDGDNFVIDGDERFSLANHRELNTRLTQLEANARFAAELAKLAARRRDCGLPAISLEADGFRVGTDEIQPYTAKAVNHYRYETEKAKPRLQGPATTRFVPQLGFSIPVRQNIIRVTIRK